MRRAMIALFVLTLTALAANIKLYLKDGGFHLVREYQVQTDRVRYYSVERSQWEEIPLELVDLKRTGSETAERQTQLAEEGKVVAEEEKAQREVRAEVATIPRDPGVYYVEDKTVKPIKAAESKVHTNKGRNVLKVLAPIPVVSGKATVELDGLHAPCIIGNAEQEFYIQLAAEERFGIVKLTPDHKVRIVEKITVVPVTKELVEEPIEVQVFRKQMTQDGLYKVWPMKPMEPGEYAVVEYTPGKTNMQVWDFAVKAGGKS
jgi:NADH dehydrogenase/NADH:ubiquinone oxidoreductase subunit G